MHKDHFHKLLVKDLGIDTYRENIIFLRSDSHVCISEGFTALTRVVVHKNGTEIVATLGSKEGFANIAQAIAAPARAQQHPAAPAVVLHQRRSQW